MRSNPYARVRWRVEHEEKLSCRVVVVVAADVCRSLKNRFSCTKRERESASEMASTGVRECKREKNTIKRKKIFLFNPFCVRARAPATVCVLLNVCVCVCVRRNYVVRQKLQSFCCVAACGGIRQRAPTPSLSHAETTLQMRSSHDYTNVCVVCVCLPAIVLVCGHVAALQI